MTNPTRTSADILTSGLMIFALAACASDTDETQSVDQEDGQAGDQDAVDDGDDGTDDLDDGDDADAEDAGTDAGDADGEDEADGEDAAAGADADEADEEGEADPGASDEAEVEIGETLEDPEMGDTVEVVSAVRHFDSDDQAELIEAGGEVVLVEVNIAPGDEYGGRLSSDNFKISWDDGADFWNNDTRMIEDEMEEADRPPLEDISRSDGGEHSGWIAFFVDEESDTYLLEYERREGEVIGSGDTIDEYVEEVEIPAN